ncbi:histone deacetylase family protein [Halocatena salina]|uniref:Histone deacetylase n=1 Tax=Halocatena salina TaxID=2934340 RepID=A0A8T9ZZD5_9EURY|nr:histone deacetylase [Halocatena salina]UPM42114.1 histone deacetylase [Halocatena salina]
MKFGHREQCLLHDTGARHPESPDRIRAIRRVLSHEHGVEYVTPESVSPEIVTTVHDPGYVEQVREFCADGGGQWDADTVAVSETWDAALASAGIAVWATETALDGASGRETPFSIGRPPGHHAIADDAMGFCFFNNAAIATETALERIDRVAIIDWDVHHGNGTNDIFYDRDDVFYASLHEQGLYPGTGTVEETGVDAGAGRTLNLPLPPGSDDAVYLYAFEEAIIPALERFDPDLLIVSAGFDAHERDPISRMRVSTEGYGVLTARCRALSDRLDAALAFVLEGGYGLESLSDGVRMINDVCDGREPVEPDEPVSESGRTVVDTAREQLFDAADWAD